MKDKKKIKLTLSHKVVSPKPQHEQILTHNICGTDWMGTDKPNYHTISQEDLSCSGGDSLTTELNFLKTLFGGNLFGEN